MSETASPALQPVIDWFERAHREYQGVVIKELSVPTGKYPDLPEAGPEIAQSRTPGLVDRVRGWLGLAPSSPQDSEIASKPDTPGISAADKSELEARIRKQIEARDDEKRQADEERRIAEASKAASQALEAQKLAGQKAPEPKAAPKPDPMPQVADAPKSLPPPPVYQPPAKAALEPPREPQIALAPPPALPPPEVKPPQPPAAKLPESAADKPTRADVAAAEPPTHVAQPPASSDMPQHWNRIDRNPVKPAEPAATHAKLAQAPATPAQLPAHWNRVERTASKPATTDDSARRLADEASKAADKILKAKPVAVASKPSASLKKSCAHAGRPAATPATYTVRRGDSLWAIAVRYYDSGARYTRIVRANEYRIKDPDLIFPCQKLYLPKRHAWSVMLQVGFSRS